MAFMFLTRLLEPLSVPQVSAPLRLASSVSPAGNGPPSENGLLDGPNADDHKADDHKGDHKGANPACLDAASAAQAAQLAESTGNGSSGIASVTQISTTDAAIAHGYFAVHVPTAVVSLSGAWLGAECRDFDVQRLAVPGEDPLAFTSVFATTASGNIYRITRVDEATFLILDGRTGAAHAVRSDDALALVSVDPTYAEPRSWMIERGRSLIVGASSQTSTVEGIVGVTSDRIVNSGDLNQVHFVADMYTDGSRSFVMMSFAALYARATERRAA